MGLGLGIERGGLWPVAVCCGLVQGLMERMFSIPLVMLSRMRSVGVNDLSRKFLNFWTI